MGTKCAQLRSISFLFRLAARPAKTPVREAPTAHRRNIYLGTSQTRFEVVDRRCAEHEGVGVAPYGFVDSEHRASSQAITAAGRRASSLNLSRSSSGIGPCAVPKPDVGLRLGIRVWWEEPTFLREYDKLARQCAGEGGRPHGSTRCRWCVTAATEVDGTPTRRPQALGTRTPEKLFRWTRWRKSKPNAQLR
jgi:hypothetical protein